MSINENSILHQYYDIVNATNIVSKTDTAGIIIYANEKFSEISGYSQKELIGNSHRILKDPLQKASTFKLLWDTITAKQVWRGIITNVRKDGTKYRVNASIFPIVNAEGEIIEYISIRHDITELEELNSQIDILNKYKTEQEHMAREKLEAGIVNDMSDEQCKILYHPSDILSGDFYSIFKRDDGSIFIYLMDGQGHGISPALTVFAISSMINHYIYDVENIYELIEQLAPSVKNFLGELEQLSYTMMMISSDKRTISYSSAGMYPFLIKVGEKIVKIKANNTPFMNFSDTPKITTLEVGEWDSLLIYSDGIVEHENHQISHYKPELLMNELVNIPQVIEEISQHEFDDDVTMIYLENSIS